MSAHVEERNAPFSMSVVSVTETDEASSDITPTSAQLTVEDSPQHSPSEDRKACQSHDQGYSDYHSDDGSSQPAQMNLSQVLSQTAEKVQQWNMKWEPDSSVEKLHDIVKDLHLRLDEFKWATQSDTQQLEEFTQNLKQERLNLEAHLQQLGIQLNNEPDSKEERKVLEAKIAGVKLSLSLSEEELIQAQSSSLQLQQAFNQAELASLEAQEEAQRLQKEAEEVAERDRLHRKKLAKERLREKEEQARKQVLEEQRRIMEEQRARMTAEQKAAHTADWESFTPTILEKDVEGFDQGVACILRAMPSLNLRNFDCFIEKQLQTDFHAEKHDELISNIVTLVSTTDGVVFPMAEPIHIAVPHCLSRASALSREAVIRMKVEGGEWVDVQETVETALDTYKDLKLAQAVVYEPCSLAVVSRYKTDYLSFHKRGGKTQSNVDGRVVFTTERNVFSNNEHVKIQMQPVDPNSLQELKRSQREICFGLFASSPIVNCVWSCTEDFPVPIQMSLPCPPNPAKARKAADARAAKERKMNNQVRGYDAYLEEEARKKEEERKRVASLTNSSHLRKWYMGTYGAEDDDERDNMFLYACDKRGKWHIVENSSVRTTRLDLVTVTLARPLERFVVLRVKTTVEDWQGIQMATIIDNSLNKRLVKVVVKQQLQDPSQAVVLVLPSLKADGTLVNLEELGYNTGPDLTDELQISEGEKCEIEFRGNIKSVGENAQPRFVFNSQLRSGMDLEIAEKSSFQAYYRGFIQIHKITTKLIKPPKTDEGIQPPAYHVEEKSLLAELHISIPKQCQSPVSQPVTKRAAVVIINTKDVITSELLRRFASQLGDEWKKLAHQLNIKRVRIQAIMREVENNPDSTEKEIDKKHDMLLTWVKRVPKYVDKVAVLYNGFIRCGRTDMAEELKTLDSDFKKQNGRSR